MHSDDHETVYERDWKRYHPDNRRPSIAGPIIITLVAIGVLVGLGFWFLNPIYHWLWVAVRYGWPMLVFCILGIVFTVKAATSYGSNMGRWLIVACSTIAFTLLCFAAPYVTAHGMYLASNVSESVDAGELDYQPRTPYDVAKAVSNRNLGATTGDAREEKTYLPADGTWTTTVERRGFAQGYESIQVMKLPQYGEARNQDVSFCSFNPKANRKLDGMMWWNSLNIAIANRTSPSTVWDSTDSVAVCADGRPVIYVPLKQLSSDILFPYWVAGGVAMYDGETGDLQILHDYQGDLPLYPQSLASAQRESLKASETYWDYLFGRSGWQDTSNDPKDPNGENRAEFSLETKTNVGEYITPLTVRGSSSSITAVGSIDSGMNRVGELAPYTVHRFPDGVSRQANSAVVATITGSILNGYKAQGLTVFEIVPGHDGKWVATIGKSQSILYKADISLDGTIVLKDRDGNIVASNSDNPDQQSQDDSSDTSQSETNADKTGADDTAGKTDDGEPSNKTDNGDSKTTSRQEDIQRLQQLLDEANKLARKIQQEQ
ncbi:hypothetical protein DF196_02410 [Bifidobacterium callitrichidarum]|uniref:Uncharacterized protein n=2 Tax=Bifidobacterium callitrichidarum TaxID=2052941 RepID=A0A2U2NCA1_9BIFI|nr:hypothetical protein DF196_02410 [Bifidobacterium callitrichidarum]